MSIFPVVSLVACTSRSTIASPHHCAARFSNTKRRKTGVRIRPLEKKLLHCLQDVLGLTPRYKQPRKGSANSCEVSRQLTFTDRTAADRLCRLRADPRLREKGIGRQACWQDIRSADRISFLRQLFARVWVALRPAQTQMARWILCFISCRLDVAPRGRFQRIHPPANCDYNDLLDFP